MTDLYGLGYVCYICKKPIKNSDIPLECKEKISMQIVWHENCKNKEIENWVKV